MGVFSKPDKARDAVEGKRQRFTPRPGLSDRLAGETDRFVSDLKPYLPQELVGGSVPHIAGSEDETVWNAASQACGTEKVHYTYSIDEGKCWYLACASSSLASNPDTWCPLAAALPGNSEHWDKETVYLYEHDGMASALRWDGDTKRMQVFLGAARSLLPRIQSMDANFVTINTDIADIVPWKNKMLNTEKLSRATTKMLLLSGVVTTFIILAFLIFQFVLTNTVQRDLESVKRQTSSVTEKLMLQAYDALQSDTIKHMVRIQELLDELKAIDGTLVKYEVSGSSVTWEALIPQGLEKSGSMKSAEVLGLEDGGSKRIRVRGRR